MCKFNSLVLVGLICLYPGCHRIGAPPSKTPFGEETGVDGPFNKVANAFLLDLEAGRFAEAYARTSKDYQKEVNEDQFKAILNRNSFPSGAGTSQAGSSDIKEMKTVEFHVEKRKDNGSLEFTFEVTKVGDEYQVQRLSLK